LFFSTFHQSGRHAEFISASFQLQKGIYFEKTLIKQTLSFPLYAAVAWYFGAPKYPKRSVNPAMGLLHSPAHIKKTAALRLISFCLCFLWAD